MPVSIRGSGQVPVQVIQTTKTDTFTTSSLTYVAVTGLVANITPTNSSNKVLVTVSLSGSATNYQSHVQLTRNGTGIFLGNASGSRVQSSGGDLFGGSNTIRNVTFSFVDSPATTSSVAYGVNVMSGGGTTAVNQSVSDSNGTDWARSPSSIIVMEISG